MTSQVLTRESREFPASGRSEAWLDLVRRVISLAFGRPENRPFGVRYWTGAHDPGDPSRGSRFTLVIRDPAALRRALLPPSELALGEAFVRGDLDVEGDLEAAGGLIDLLRANLSAPGRVASLAALLLRLPGADPQPGDPSALQRAHRPWWPRHTRHRDAAAIRHHYDVGNDFYRLWLDPQTVYSCAYFPPGVRDVERAQQAKLDYICRKLRLQPGERLLDIGCGWGALIRHAVRHYGVEAVGITLSPAQAELAAGRIAAEGLQGRCRVELRDYRELPDVEAYDKVASVGMFEHVGRSHLAEYFARVYRALRPGGLFLNHGIIDLEDARPPSLGVRLRRRLLREGKFMRRYVFPDSELVPLARAVAAAEAAGFETRDVENLREHYVFTLREWVRRLEARDQEAIALVGPATVRVWRLYLAVSAHAFATGRMSVVQHLLAKPGPRPVVPDTRHHLYVDAHPGLKVEGRSV